MTALTFGVGISNSAAPEDDPVAAAQEAERLGYDFVSTSDHPCGLDPTYETATLLTWIAAKTTRIAVASRVLGMPFRAPAIVAKLAESLNRLSGDRLILGLGGGYSDDEIHALGLPARSPREKVDGLFDAVSIIRGAWSEDGFTHHGSVHRVDGMDMAPKPSRPIPIWLGTFGPRALAVTGRVADGWIPSLGFAPPDRIPAMRDRILDAASAAGRKPDEITCVYNVGVRVDASAQPRPDAVVGSVERVVDRLHEFAELGFDGFNVMPIGPDKPRQVREIAEHVVPALRTR